MVDKSKIEEFFESINSYTFAAIDLANDASVYDESEATEKFDKESANLKGALLEFVNEIFLEGQKMTDEQIDNMIMDLLEQVDHDIAKSYNVKTAEEPEYVEEDMEVLRNIVKSHM